MECCTCLRAARPASCWSALKNHALQPKGNIAFLVIVDPSHGACRAHPIFDVHPMILVEAGQLIVDLVFSSLYA